MAEDLEFDRCIPMTGNETMREQKQWPHGLQRMQSVYLLRLDTTFLVKSLQQNPATNIYTRPSE